MLSFSEFIFRVFVAVACGAFIGHERSHHIKIAGSRTFSLIVLGSSVFMMIPLFFIDNIFLLNDNIIPYQIILGIGFIGAGVIWKHHEEFHGITTAATIWALAGLGMLIGLGLIKESLVLCIIIYLILASKGVGMSIGLINREDESLNRTYSQTKKIVYISRHKNRK